MRLDVDGVLFDFDGTLAPNLDLPDMRRQVVALTKAHSVPEEVFADCYIVEVIDAARDYLQQRRDRRAERYYEQAHQLIIDIEIESAQATDPFPGVPEMLSSLRSSGVRTGIVTRNCRAAVLEVFPGVLDRVDSLHARGDSEFLKPDPRHIIENLDAIGVRPSRAAIVGDSQLDMSVGRSLGMCCVGVLSGSSDEQRLADAGADVILASCLELEALIE